MEQSETAEKLVKLLKKKNLTVTTAESCTGGMIASAIVSVAGASACFKEGYITYSNEAKKKLLGVREDTLKQYTVVSAQVAQEMAAGAAAAVAVRENGGQTRGCDLERIKAILRADGAIVP